MNQIEFEIWEPIPETPKQLRYVGQRTAEEVFAELKTRLDSMGYLPDGYFMMSREWENGREIPKGADIFCTTDYGESEGVYIDVYLKWYKDGAPVTKSFITGKTLSEDGSAMDRMFLIGSAITKAFHGDSGSYPRYVKPGEVQAPKDMILHLNPDEQRTFIDALVRQREGLLADVDKTEKLLRRMTGSITAYMSEVGQRPLRISNYDKTVLAIQDGEVNVFKELLPQVIGRCDKLLPIVAGRPGNVGMAMLEGLLSSASSFSQEAYMTACKNAIETGPVQRVRLLMDEAQSLVKDLEPEFYGEVISCALLEHKRMAGELIRRCPKEWIANANPRLFYSSAISDDFNSAVDLIQGGIDTAGCAADVFQYLCRGNEWMAISLLDCDMYVSKYDFPALHVCVKSGSLNVASKLLEKGMDFDSYKAWMENSHLSSEVHDDTLKALSERWDELRQLQKVLAQSM